MLKATNTMAIAGSGLCIPDEAFASAHAITDCSLDTSILPAMVRRRTSLATRVTLTAAERACAMAGVERTLPSIFASSAGEVQITDKLCSAIARQEYPLSPTQFHNSVHNTAAGYWSMATGSMASMQAMGAMDDGFALGLLEAWCQLQTVTEQVLLVVYDEAMPAQLLPDYRWETCAFALVLNNSTGDLPRLQQPSRLPASDPAQPATEFSAQNPAMAALPLFQALQRGSSGKQSLTLAGDWQLQLEIP